MLQLQDRNPSSSHPSSLRYAGQAPPSPHGRRKANPRPVKVLFAGSHLFTSPQSPPSCHPDESRDPDFPLPCWLIVWVPAYRRDDRGFGVNSWRGTRCFNCKTITPHLPSPASGRGWFSLQSSGLARFRPFWQHRSMTNTGRLLGGLAILLTVLTAAPALAFADYFGNSDRDIREAGGTVSRVTPNWRIVCFAAGGDAYGVATPRRHCRIEKGDFRVIAVMTAEGLSIPYLPSRPICGSYGGKMRIDGIAISKLPLRAKLAAMSHGITFARPYQTPWPECHEITEYTGLYRFSAALSRLRAEWRKFK